MPISLVGYSTVVTTSSSTTIVTNVPSGVQSGDLMLVQLCAYNIINITPPSGWKLLTRWWNYGSNAIQSGFGRHAVYWKIAGANEPSSYSWGTASACMGGMSVWRGVDSTRPFEDWAFNGARASTTSVTFPACGGGTTDRIVLRIYGQVGETRASVTWSSGVTEIFNVSDAVYGRAILARENSVNTSERTATLGATKDTWTTLTLVLLPSGETPQTNAGLRHAVEYWTSLSTVTSVTLRGGFATSEDYLILAAVHNSGSTPTAPSGFSLVAQGDFGTNSRLSIWDKPATTEEPETYTVSFSSATRADIILAMFRKVSSVAAYDTAVGSNVTSITLPSVSYSAQTAIDYRVVGQSSSSRPSSPSGFSVITWTYSTGGRPLLGAFRILEGQSETGTTTITFSAAENVRGYTLALAPAPTPPVLLSGTAAGTSLTTGMPTVTRQLAGQASGSAQVSASLTVSRLLAGTAVGHALASGTLHVGQLVLLAGTATGGADATAQLAVLRALAGQASGSSATSGSIAIARLFAGSASGSALVTGDLLIARLLAGTATGTSRTSGDLRVGADVLLSGTAAGTSLAQGDLLVFRGLAGLAVGMAATGGGLLVVRGLAGSAVGSSQASAPTPRWVSEGVGVGAGEALAVLAVVAVGVAVGDGIATVPGVIAVEAVGVGIGDGLALVQIPAQALVLTTQARLEPGDLVWLVAPLAGLQGRTGLCRVLAVEYDPDRGERRYRVQLVPMAEAEDMLAANELWRPPTAIDRTTNLARLLRKRRRDD